MLSPDNIKGFTHLVGLLWDVILGAVGGFIAYLYEFKKAVNNKKATDSKESVHFSFSGLIINVCMGTFVGYLIGTVLDDDTYARDIIICLSGFCAFGLLVLAESKFANWLYNKMSKGEK